MADSTGTSPFSSDLDVAWTRVTQWLEHKGERLLAGPHWRIKVVCCVVTVAAMRAFPSYDALGTEFVREKWRSTQKKIEQPFLDNTRVFPPNTHESNLTFRLTVPLVAHALELQPAGVLMLSAAAGCLLLFRMAGIVFRLTGSGRAAFFTCLAVATTWPGAAALHELRGGYYDAVALCLLVLALSASSPVAAGGYTFLAVWTDERALPASALSMLFYLLGHAPAGVRKAAAVAIAGGVYCTARMYVSARYAYGTHVTGVGAAVLLNQINTIPLACGRAWAATGSSSSPASPS
jgi:hypothetical protein